MKGVAFVLSKSIKYCIKCGFELSSDVNFCPNCGQIQNKVISNNAEQTVGETTNEADFLSKLGLLSSNPQPKKPSIIPGFGQGSNYNKQKNNESKKQSETSTQEKKKQNTNNNLNGFFNNLNGGQKKSSEKSTDTKNSKKSESNNDNSLDIIENSAPLDNIPIAVEIGSTQQMDVPVLIDESIQQNDIPIIVDINEPVQETSPVNIGIDDVQQVDAPVVVGINDSKENEIPVFEDFNEQPNEIPIIGVEDTHHDVVPVEYVQEKEIPVAVDIATIDQPDIPMVVPVVPQSEPNEIPISSPIKTPTQIDTQAVEQEDIPMFIDSGDLSQDEIPVIPIIEDSNQDSVPVIPVIEDPNQDSVPVIPIVEDSNQDNIPTIVENIPVKQNNVNAKALNVGEKRVSRRDLFKTGNKNNIAQQPGKEKIDVVKSSDNGNISKNQEKRHSPTSDDGRDRKKSLFGSRNKKENIVQSDNNLSGKHDLKKNNSPEKRVESRDIPNKEQKTENKQNNAVQINKTYNPNASARVNMLKKDLKNNMHEVFNDNTNSFANMKEAERLPDEIEDEKSSRHSASAAGGTVAEGRKKIDSNRHNVKREITQQDVDSRKIEDIVHVHANEEGYDDYYENVLTLDHDLKIKRKIPVKNILFILGGLAVLVAVAYFYLSTQLDL